MSPPRVCAIILNWNGADDTLECLDSLAAAERVPDTIIVVDNGSSDNSVEEIYSWGKDRYGEIILLERGEGELPLGEEDVPPFLLIFNGINLGFSGGNNSAISWALSRKTFNFIWILNNDTVVRSDSMTSLLECAHHSSADILGSTVVYADKDDVVQCAGGCSYHPFTTIFRPFLTGKPLEYVIGFSGRPKIDYIYGASLFARSEVFANCGLFNDAYFLFYEEIDLCRRATKAGYSLYWCRESVISHKVSRSVGNPNSGDRKKISKANYHENLSTLLYTQRFHPALLPFAMLFRFFGKLAVIVGRRELHLLKPLLKAYKDFVMCKMFKRQVENAAVSGDCQ